MSRRPSFAPLLVLAGLALVAGIGCGIPGSGGLEAGAGVVDRPPPAPPGAMAPNWGVGGEALLLSWLEPAAGAGHRLRFSSLGAEGWEEPVTIAQGEGFFANWADFPSVASGPDGELLAHWLAKTGPETYAYSIELARSADRGKSWRRLGTLNDDATPTEHGFVSLVPLAAEGIQAFWLDGREMGGGHDAGEGHSAAGAMTLRTARVGTAVEASTVLDPRVCDCCQTGAALTAAGPVVVFRDRSAEEVRDISAVGPEAGGWSAPRPVAQDGWHLSGCPVNGPVAAASGQQLAVAWFTGAEPSPRVLVAFSADSGTSFSPPLVIDDDHPLGRVGLVLDGEGAAVVSWLALVSTEEAEIRLRRVAADGRQGEPFVLARTGASRSSGFPRLTRRHDRLYVAWTEVTGDRTSSRLRAAELPLAAVPRP